MGEFDVRATDDPERALAGAEEFLKSRPVEHNVLLTLLDQRTSHPEQGRYWTVCHNGDVVGFAMRTPPTRPLLLTPMSRSATEAVATAIAAEHGTTVAGVTAEAATAATFAGCWSELVPGPVTVGEGQRLYGLDELTLPSGIPGTLRRARDDERTLLGRWLSEFCTETGAPVGDPDDAVRGDLAAGRLFVWDNEGPVGMARATSGAMGVSRIGFVYTPPELRGRGYAAACVGATSEYVRDVEGLECVLFTQLANPTSNRVYRRLGYRAVAELLSYEFPDS